MKIVSHPRIMDIVFYYFYISTPFLSVCYITFLFAFGQ